MRAIFIGIALFSNHIIYSAERPLPNFISLSFKKEVFHHWKDLQDIEKNILVERGDIGDHRKKLSDIYSVVCKHQNEAYFKAVCLGLIGLGLMPRKSRFGESTYIPMQFILMIVGGLAGLVCVRQIIYSMQLEEMFKKLLCSNNPEEVLDVIEKK